jgi:hypothetical protein
MGEAERLSSTVAPARAASWLGGTGTHMSSQISTCTARSGWSSAVNEQVGAEGDLAIGVCAGPVRPHEELAR